MSKDFLDKTADSAKRAVDDAKDLIHEGGHRSAAEMEKARRDMAGDDLTAGEKARSVVDEAKQRVQAEVDAVKRKVRDNT